MSGSAATYSSHRRPLSQVSAVRGGERREEGQRKVGGVCVGKDGNLVPCMGASCSVCFRGEGSGMVCGGGDGGCTTTVTTTTTIFTSTTTTSTYTNTNINTTTTAAIKININYMKTQSSH